MNFDLHDYILVFENIVPDELCDEILAEYSNDKNWVTAPTNKGITNTRRCDVINISDFGIVAQDQEKRKMIDDKLFFCAGNAIKKYNENFKYSLIEGDSGYHLLRYQKGDFFKEHTDHYLQQPRTVSCSFALNDGYEGGEWGFFDREMVVKVPKGSAVLFPSNFMYPHEIMPVTKGTRYSIVTWFT